MYTTSFICRKMLPIILPLSLLPSFAVANDSSLSVKFENDGLSSSDDGHYTSGFELNWTFTPQEQSWTQRLAAALPNSGWGAAVGF